MTKERDKYWDIIKGVAIILMVVGHSIEYGGGQLFRDSGAYYENRVFQLLYAFHMPLFMLVAGYFYYGSEKRYQWKDLLIKKCRSLLLPIFSFSILNYVLKFDMAWTVTEAMKQFVTTFFGTLWFLWVLLVIILIQILLRRLKFDGLIPNILIVIALYFLPDVWHLDMLAFMYPFFLVGYYLAAKEVCLWQKTRQCVVSTISIILFAILLIPFNSELLVYKSGTCLLSDRGFLSQGGIDIYRLVIGFAGCIASMCVIKLLQKYLIWVAPIGVCSMGIYCFQDVVLCVYHHFTRDFAKPELWWWILAFCVIFASCYVLTLISRRIKILNVLLLGGR